MFTANRIQFPTTNTIPKHENFHRNPRRTTKPQDEKKQYRISPKFNTTLRRHATTEGRIIYIIL